MPSKNRPGFTENFSGGRIGGPSAVCARSIPGSSAESPTGSLIISSAGRFAVSLVVSVFLHGLVLLAADPLVGDPVGDPALLGRKEAVPEPVRLAMVIHLPAVAGSRDAGPPVPAKPQETPAAPPSSSGSVEDSGIRITETTAEAVMERETEVATVTDEVVTEAAVTEAGTEGITGVVSERPSEPATEVTTTAVTGIATGMEDAAGPAGPSTPGSSDDTAEPYDTAVITRPVAVNRTPPVYPRAAQENNWEGSVLLDAVILPDGNVGDLRVERSSGYSLLDEAALAAVKNWRYRPALKENTPVACRIKIRIQFKLEE